MRIITALQLFGMYGTFPYLFCKIYIKIFLFPPFSSPDPAGISYFFLIYVVLVL